MLQLKNVSFSYNKGQTDEIQALSNINLSIKENEFISIIGENGSGKSTLAQLLNGLLKPTEGEVFIGGLSTKDDKNLLKIRQKVGLLFQNPDNQIIAILVDEDVAFGPENLGVERSEIIERVETSLASVGMQSYKKYEPHNLSAGQRQKVAIASVLAMQPDYLVLDEPTSYLDPASRQDILKLLKRINKERQISIINITHYVDQVFVSERVVSMQRGEISFDGSVEEFFSNDKALKASGIERPLWLEVKQKYVSRISELKNVSSAESLGEILCSLS